ncbi:hypothetical protein Goari_006455, partial [Gossypium aridum]|nr:hypothetical protein [Gossypium aridum]
LGQSAPVSPDESRENTIERVALRCLEEPIEIKLYTIHIPISALLYELQLKGDIKKFDCLHGDKQMEDESGITIKVTKIDGCHLGHDSQSGEGEEDVNVTTKTFERPCMDQLCENEDERLNIAMKRSLKFAEQT